MKDKKKFGGCSLTSKNRSCKKFGWSYDKETRRIWRIEAKRMAHKVLILVYYAMVVAHLSGKDK